MGYSGVESFTGPGRILRRRSLALRAGFALLMAATMSGCKAPDDSERTAIEILKQRSLQAADRAHGFDQRTFLQNLTPHPDNGYCKRFDENLEEIEVIEHPWISSEPATSLLALEFDGTDAVGLIPSEDPRAGLGGDEYLNDGHFTVTNRKTTRFSTNGVLDIEAREIGDLLVRVRTHRGRNLRFTFVTNQRQVHPPTVQIELIADGAVHDYRVELADQFLHAADAKVVAVELEPRWVVGDVLQLDSVVIESSISEYSDAPFGLTHVLREGELRRTLYSQTPVSLRYRLADLPQQPLRFEFGASVHRDDSPVTFAVTTTTTNGELSSQSWTVSDAGSWTDIAFEIQPSGDGHLDMVLSTTSVEGNIGFWSNPQIRGQRLRPLHVIVALEDAFRGDRIAPGATDAPVAAFKESLVSGAAVFRNAYSQTTETRTSCPTLMTGLYASATGVWNFYQRLDEGYLTMAEILRHQGFVTVSIIQNENAGPSAGLQQGFSYLVRAQGSRAETVYLNHALEVFDRFPDRNVFLYLHVLDPHGPFDPPEPYLARYRLLDRSIGEPVDFDTVFFDPKWIPHPTREGRIALYDGEIEANDGALRGLFDELTSRRILEDSLFFFLSDHGEFLGEQGRWGHQPPAMRQVVNTPMIFLCSRLFRNGSVINVPVQNVDVLPTILEILGVPYTSLPLHGRSLLPLAQSRPEPPDSDRFAYAEEIILKNNRTDSRPFASLFFRDQQVMISESMGRVTFNLRADPHGQNPIDLDPSLTAVLIDGLRAAQASNLEIWRALSDRSSEIAVDPKAQDALRALGYLESNSGNN